MTERFVKVYETLLESSLWWGEDESTRLVWITLLMAADWKGVYRGTVPGLAGKARVDLEACRRALERLEAPDLDSRTEEFEGRRIERLPGEGWRLLNYEKYRDKRSERQVRNTAAVAAKRAATAADMSPSQRLDLRSEIRDPRSENPSGIPPVVPQEGTKPKKAPRRTRLPEDFAPIAGHVSLAKERNVSLEEELPKFIDHHTAKATVMADWNAAFRTWIRNADKFRSGQRGAQAPRGGAFGASRTDQNMQVLADRLTRLRAQEALEEKPQ
jgi:hypothetical protein